TEHWPCASAARGVIADSTPARSTHDTRPLKDAIASPAHERANLRDVSRFVAAGGEFQPARGVGARLDGQRVPIADSLEVHDAIPADDGELPAFEMRHERADRQRIARGV